MSDTEKTFNEHWADATKEAKAQKRRAKYQMIAMVVCYLLFVSAPIVRMAFDEPMTLWSSLLPIIVLPWLGMFFASSLREYEYAKRFLEHDKAKPRVVHFTDLVKREND